MKKNPLKNQTIHLFTLVALFLTLALSSTPPLIHFTIISDCHTLRLSATCVKLFYHSWVLLQSKILRSISLYMQIFDLRHCLSWHLQERQLIALFFNVSTEQRTTQQGQVYFLHTQTGVSTWHDPRVPRYVYDLCLHF